MSTEPRSYIEGGIRKRVTFSHYYSSTQPSGGLTVVPTFHLLGNKANTADTHVVSAPSAFQGLNIFRDDLDSVAPSINDKDRIKLYPKSNLSKDFSDDPNTRPRSIEAYFRANQDLASVIGEWFHERTKEFRQMEQSLETSRASLSVAKKKDRKQVRHKVQSDLDSLQAEVSKHALRVNLWNDFGDFVGETLSKSQVRTANLREDMAKPLSSKSLTHQQTVFVGTQLAGLNLTNARMRWFTQTTRDCMGLSNRESDHAGEGLAIVDRCKLILEQMRSKTAELSAWKDKLRNLSNNSETSWDEVLSQPTNMTSRSLGDLVEYLQAPGQTGQETTTGIKLSHSGAGHISIMDSVVDQKSSRHATGLKPKYPLYTFIQPNKDEPGLQITSHLYPIYQVLQLGRDPAEAHDMKWLGKWDHQEEVSEIENLKIDISDGSAPPPGVHYAAALIQAAKHIQHSSGVNVDSNDLAQRESSTSETSTEKEAHPTLEEGKGAQQQHNVHEDCAINTFKMFCFNSADAYISVGLKALDEAKNKLQEMREKYNYTLSAREEGEWGMMDTAMNLDIHQVAGKMRQAGLSLVTERIRDAHDPHCILEESQIEYNRKGEERCMEQLSVLKQQTGVGYRLRFGDWLTSLGNKCNADNLSSLESVTTQTSTAQAKKKRAKTKKLHQKPIQPEQSDNNDKLDVVPSYPEITTKTEQNSQLDPGPEEHSSECLPFHAKQRDDERPQGESPNVYPQQESVVSDPEEDIFASSLAGWTTIHKKDTWPGHQGKPSTHRADYKGKYMTMKNIKSRFAAQDEAARSEQLSEVNHMQNMARQKGMTVESYRSQLRSGPSGKWGVGPTQLVSLGERSKMVKLDEKGEETIRKLQLERAQWDHDPTLEARARLNELIGEEGEQTSSDDEDEGKEGTE